MRSIAFAILAVTAVGLNVFAQVVSAGQGGDSDSVGGHALDLAVGVTFAVCAAIARRLGAQRVSWLMVVGATSWTFGTFANGLIVISAWWVPFVAFQSTLAIVIAVLALSYPTGRIGSLIGRVVVAAIVAMWAADVIAHLFFYDYGSLCTCIPNPIAIVSDQLHHCRHQLPARLLGHRERAASRGRGGDPVASRQPPVAGRESVDDGRCPRALRGTPRLRPLDHPCLREVRMVAPPYVAGAATASIPVIFVVGLHGLTQTRARVADVILAARTGIDRPEWGSADARGPRRQERSHPLGGGRWVRGCRGPSRRRADLRGPSRRLRRLAPSPSSSTTPPPEPSASCWNRSPNPCGS